MRVKNGRFSAEIKPIGGKLVRCSLDVKDGIIVDAKFTGDFFMMPEEAIKQLERHIMGCGTERECVRCAIENFFTMGIDVAGVTSDDFVHVIIKAIDKH